MTPPTPELSPLSDEALAELRRELEARLATSQPAIFLGNGFVLRLIAEVERSRQLRQRLSYEIVRAAASDDHYNNILRVLYRVAVAQPRQGGEEGE